MSVSDQTLDEFVALVRTYPGHTPAEYSRAMGLTLAHVNRIVLYTPEGNELVRSGLVARTPQGKAPAWMDIPGAKVCKRNYKPLTRANYFAVQDALFNGSMEAVEKKGVIRRAGDALKAAFA